MNQGDVINFLTQFLPALAELGVRVEMLENAVYAGQHPQLGAQPSAPAESAEEQPEGGEIDFFGMKINVADMLKANGGDPKSIMSKVAEWKAKQQQTTTPAAPAAPTPPTNGGSS